MVTMTRKLLTVAALFAAAHAHAQIYGGMSAGICQTHEHVYNYNTQHNETLKEPSIQMSFPAGYALGPVRFESGLVLNGATYIPINVGYALLSDRNGITLLAGFNDHLLIDKNPLQITHVFPWNVTGRLQLGIVYMECRYVHEDAHGQSVAVSLGIKSL